MLEWFIQRWQVEVTFEEARAHLVLETQRQWSHRTIARTTPILLAQECLAAGQLPVCAAAWYAQTQPTFSDTLA